jgi:trigger factor
VAELGYALDLGSSGIFPLRVRIPPFAPEEVSLSEGLIEKVEVKEDKAWKRTLRIEIPAERVDSEFEKVFQEYRNKARIKGFRPGKVPMNLIRTKFKEAAAREVLESLVPDAYENALKHKNLTPVTTPRIADIEIEPGSPLKFTAEIEIRPEIELKDYKRIVVTRKVIKVTEEDIEKNLKMLQEKNAVLKPTERAAKDGDYLVVDLERLNPGQKDSQKTEKAENQGTFLDSKKLLAEFYRGLQGAKPGDEKQIEAIYPKEYHDSKLAGKIVNYKVNVKEVKETNLPELDDDFARSLGKFKDLKDLRQKIQEDLERKAEEETDKDLKNQLVREIVTKNSFEVPQTLLNHYLDSVVEDFKKQNKDLQEGKLREQYKALGENRIRWQFLMHQIAEKEKIEVGQADIDDFTRKFAQNYKLELDKAREFLARQKELENIKENILEEKVLDFLLSNAVVRDEGKSRIITL